MPAKQHARQRGADRARLDDSRMAAESRPEILPISAARQAAARRLRRQRLVEAIARLGAPRIWFEFVDELIRHHPDIADDIDRRLARYAAVDAEILAAVGGDRFPMSPTRAVSR